MKAIHLKAIELRDRRSLFVALHQRASSEGFNFWGALTCKV
jgi:hypothetical protein